MDPTSRPPKPAQLVSPPPDRRILLPRPPFPPLPLSFSAWLAVSCAHSVGRSSARLLSRSAQLLPRYIYLYPSKPEKTLNPKP